MIRIHPDCILDRVNGLHSTANYLKVQVCASTATFNALHRFNESKRPHKALGCAASLTNRVCYSSKVCARSDVCTFRQKLTPDARLS